MVHHASLSASFLTLNSKTPLFCAMSGVQKMGQIKREIGEASTFFSCAAFSSALYPSKTAASAAKVSDVWRQKK
jgi:hypothetical protein